MSDADESGRNFEKLSKAITEAVMTSPKVKKIISEIQEDEEICPKSFMVLVLKMEVLTDTLELEVEEEGGSFFTSGWFFGILGAIGILAVAAFFYLRMMAGSGEDEEDEEEGELEEDDDDLDLTDDLDMEVEEEDDIVVEETS